LRAAQALEAPPPRVRPERAAAPRAAILAEAS